MMKLEPTNLAKYAQVISKEMLDALKESAGQRGISLDMEIALRLSAIMTEPELNEDNSILNQLAQQKFSTPELMAECKRKREGNLFVFEIEKLRHYLQFKHALPRRYKEHFILINVKEWAQIIQKELDAEK